MERFVLTDAQWAKMAPHCLGKPTDPGRSGKDNRLFVEAVLWIVRTGSPWRDLPLHFGKWNTAFKRYRDWVKAGVFLRLFEACSDEPDLEYAIVDATIVKVHRHGQGAKGGLILAAWTDDSAVNWCGSAGCGSPSPLNGGEDGGGDNALGPFGG
jgi:transposase